MILRAIKKLLSTKEIEEDNVECTIDEEVVDCREMDSPSYIGVPAPVCLEEDPWFGSAPEPTEKQLDYIEKETVAKQQEEEKRREYNGEPCGMHQLMYEMATSNWNTVKETQGGSENFQEGPGGWQSGTGR